MTDSYHKFRNELIGFLPAKRVITDPLHRLTYGTDASFYRLIPEIVIKVETENEVISVLALANKYDLAVTFRAAGTSLSGQAVSDSILVLMSGETWRDYKIHNEGNEISLQPGIIGGQVNILLARYGRKIGPDPASVNTAKIGGIAANNASGMCCGTAQNSYQTLAGMRIVFADGAILDTQDNVSIEDFKISHALFIDEINKLTASVKSNNALTNKIRHKFRLKNTTGYSLNALIDFEDPIDVIQHLLIGSEGTLGFISEITYQTVIEHPHKATALILFADVETACKAVAALMSSPVTAVELMDRAALRSVQNKQGMPRKLASLSDQAAALLVDVRAQTIKELDSQIAKTFDAIKDVEPLYDIEFTSDLMEYSRLWNIRKGLFPSIGAVRETGTTVIIEDVAFPLSSLAQGTLELQALFIKYQYYEAIIFGHALDGNLHFVFTQDFSSNAEIQRYEAFMYDVAELVAHRFGGSLKAEHGTGRNMAPFVEMEWGTDAYQLMQQIKQLFDPTNILNPGVIINDDPDIHIKNLKPLPPADELIDRCTECGFCEPICPSRNLSLTPRQRIVAIREISRMQTVNDSTDRLNDFIKTYQYEGIDTCAIDGLCATRCPVGIDTGELTRKLKVESNGPIAQKLAKGIQSKISPITTATRFSLKFSAFVGRIVGELRLEKLSAIVTRISGNRIPSWHRYLPTAASHPVQEVGNDINGKAVYFPSCVSRSMGTASSDKEKRDLQEVLNNLIKKAGYATIIPQDVDKLCCGMPFASKGVLDTANLAVNQLEESLWQASQQGKYPILCDTSPCTLQMIESFTKPLQLYETAGFIHKFLIPHLTINSREKSIALHVTCSSQKMNLDSVLLDLANLCAETVITPEEQGCCGFAGDRGFSVPELNASALKRLKQQLPDDCSGGYSNSRTCEIGLSLHSGKHYRSIAYLVDNCCS